MMLAGNIPGKTQTMSIAIYTAMQGGDREKAYIWVGHSHGHISCRDIADESVE